jgi:hypothetical protein
VEVTVVGTDRHTTHTCIHTDTHTPSSFGREPRIVKDNMEEASHGEEGRVFDLDSTRGSVIVVKGAVIVGEGEPRRMECECECAVMSDKVDNTIRSVVELVPSSIPVEEMRFEGRVIVPGQSICWVTLCSREEGGLLLKAGTVAWVNTVEETERVWKEREMKQCGLVIEKEEDGLIQVKGLIEESMQRVVGGIQIALLTGGIVLMESGGDSDSDSDGDGDGQELVVIVGR